MAGSKGVDIHPATPGVACINRELDRAAALHDVGVDALHALLVKFIVIAKAHDVLQQTALLDLRPTVADLHAAPIRLTGDQAIAFEQVAEQHLGDGLFIESGLQQLRGRGVVRAFQIQPIQ